jgi:hypothetical protein
MALSALLGVFLQNRFLTDHTLQILITFFLGGILGWLPGVAMARLIAFEQTRIVAQVATIICLAVSTLIITALIFALQYRVFYAQWHEPAFSRIWFFQQLFTSLGAAYQFAVLGTRLCLPAAPVFLLAASYALCRRMR